LSFGLNHTQKTEIMNSKQNKFLVSILSVLLFSLSSSLVFSQDVVINEYYNSGGGSGADDEIELLVIKDSADLRGLWVKDFSSSNANDGGGGYQFKSVALWNNVRAGTIIQLRKPGTALTIDITTGCSDYNLAMNLNNTTYFTTGSNSLDIATNDMIMIKSGTQSGTANNIHTLRSGTAAAQWSGISSGTRLGTTTTTGSAKSASVNNASSVIGDFNLGTSGVTGGGSSTMGTFNNTNNQNFILLLRGPVPASATSVSSSGFTANWGSLTGATKYYLTVDDDSTFASPLSGYDNLDVGTSTSQAVSGLTASTTYYYRLKAQNATPTVSGYSCAEAITTTAGSTPNITVSTSSVTGLDTTINNVSGAQSFTVSGDNLTADVDLNFVTGNDFEMSSTSASAGFTNTLTLTQSGGDLVGEPVTIWVRMKSQTNPATLTDTINFTSTSAVTRQLELSGTVSAIYYSANTGFLDDVSTWGVNTDGSGANPVSFTTDQTTYIATNRSTATISADWTVSGTNSKVIIGDGTSAIDVDIPSGLSITATIDMDSLAELTMNNTVINHTYGTRANGHTLEYAQNSSFNIPQITYYNLKLTNGTKVWAGNTTTIDADLTYEDVILDAAPSAPFTTINIAGNLTVNGTLTNPSIANSYTFVCTSSGSQTISGNGQQINFFRLQTTGTSTINLSNSSGGTSLQLGNASSGGFSLVSGSTLVLNDNSISTVSNNNASFFPATTGVIRGSSNASLTINSAAATVGTMYMDQTTPGITNVLKNLTYNLTNASGTLTLGNELQVEGVVTHTDGTLASAGNLVLKATGATAYGQIAGTGTGSISGNLTAEYMITGGGEGWRPICSPVNGATLAQLSDDYNLDFGSLSAESANTYYFDESAAPYWNIASGTSASMDSRAYSIYMGGTATWANPLPLTMDITGTYAGTANYTVTGLTRTGSIADTTGWQVIRNPWPSAFLWDGTATTVNDVANVQGQQVWIFNQSDSSYFVFDNATPGVVPPFTPFSLKVVSNNTDLTFNNSARTTDSLRNYFDKTGFENYLALTVTGPTGKSDVVKWYTSPDAANGYDIYDGTKKFNTGAPNMFFMLEGEKANKEVWNTIPEANQPVFINFYDGNAGKHTINFYMDNMAAEVEITLEDLVTGKMHKVGTTPYVFDYQTNSPQARFVLHFSKTNTTTATTHKPMPQNVVQTGCNGNNVTLIINKNGNFDATVFDLLGRPVSATQPLQGSAQLNTINLSGLAAGYYLLQVKGEGITKTEKIYIK
jgi:molybdopterin-binding protein